jgi:hypothetical protein
MPRRSRYPFITLKPYVGDGVADGDDELEVFQDTSGSNANIRHNGAVYKLKVMQAQFQVGTDVMDVTGEYVNNLSEGTTPGSTSGFIYDTVYKSLTQIKGRVTFTGTVPNASAIGLASLETAAGSEMDIAFMLGLGEPTAGGAAIRNILLFRMVPETVTIDWNIEMPSIGISITGPMTGAYGDGTGGGEGSHKAPITEIAEVP